MGPEIGWSRFSKILPGSYHLRDGLGFLHARRDEADLAQIQSSAGLNNYRVLMPRAFVAHLAYSGPAPRRREQVSTLIEDAATKRENGNCQHCDLPECWTSQAKSSLIHTKLDWQKHGH